MNKLTYEIEQTTINNYKLILKIYHEKNNVFTQFFDNGNITHYSDHDELYLFNKYNDFIISFYVKMNEVTGIHFIKEKFKSDNDERINNIRN